MSRLLDISITYTHNTTKFNKNYKLKVNYCKHILFWFYFENNGTGHKNISSPSLKNYTLMIY